MPETTGVRDTFAVRAKPPRPLWRRIVRIASRLLGAIVLLVVLAIAFLHTSWGKSVVRGRIESKLAAAVNGEVKLGSLDYSFMFGEIELGGLEIRDASGAPAISIAAITVDLDRSSVLDGAPVIDDLKIDGLEVSVVQTADGRSNLTGLFKPSDRKPLKQIRVARLAVSGTATLTRPDGTTIAVHELGLAGSLDARPAANELELVLARLGAKVAISKPGAPTKNLDVAIDSITLGRRPDALDVDVGKLAIGAVGIESLGAHLRLAGGQLRGDQSITIGKTRVDSKQLATLLGREVLLDDVAMDVTISGPEDKLVLHGVVRTRDTNLALDGTVDFSTPARPRYQLALVGKGRSIDVVVPRPGKRPLPAIETDMRLDLAGSGVSLVDLEAELGLVVGPTKVGAFAIEGLTAKAVATRGAYRLATFDARGLGFEITATGELAADQTVHGRVKLSGSPAHAMKVLAAAGIAIPPKVPPLQQLDLVVTASGKLDGELAVELEPTRIAIAGGAISLAGTARLDNKLVRDATAKLGLHSLDLATLARLAGRPPKVLGSISGTIEVARTGASLSADYGLTIALREPALRVIAKGRANDTSVSTRAEVVRASDRSVLATLNARIPLDHRRLQPAGSWRVAVDIARRPLAELTALVPEHLRHRVPPRLAATSGEVELHVDLAGTPARPTGSIALAVTAAALPQGSQKIDLHLTLAPQARGLAVATRGTIALDAAGSPLAIIDGTVAMPAPFVGGKLDVANLRAGLTVDATVDLPDRELASLAGLRPKLAELGGHVGGRIVVRGPLKTPTLDARLRWHGYGTATGGAGETTIVATGTATALTATITHGGAVAIVADIDRRNPDRIAIHATARAAETPLIPLVPAFAAGKLAMHDPGRLRWDMEGTFALVRTPAGLSLEELNVTGALDLKGAAIAIPNSDRRWHDIGLELVSEPRGIRIKSLALHETDVEQRDRRIEISGLLALDHLRPSKLSLELVAHDWLLFGTPTFGASDAPKATADFDIGVEVDLAAPIIAVDATVKSLALRSPDRLERGHQPELASVSGDIIFLDATSGPAGKLPVAPPTVVAAPRKRRAIDARIHIPKPIRLNQTPFDVMAHGELTVTVRDEGVTTRGGLTMASGTLSLFGHEHALVDGNLTFSDEHPQGWLALTFERRLPDLVMRELARASGGARISFAGPPTKPKTSLHGAANAALAEVMAMYNAGRPVHISRPGLPASSTVQAPRGDQLSVLTFMAQNLPHLLFLDRISAWADPYQGAGAYGRITNVEADRYSRDERRRVRAVVRPPTPGRSNAELQWDRVFINNDRTAFGVGVRAGDRLGGGLGLFLEWSSAR